MHRHLFRQDRLDIRRMDFDRGQNKLHNFFLNFVVDGLLIKLGCKKEFNVEQPFKFMEQIAVETKGNFFESRTVEYQKAKLNETISFDEDF